MATDEGKSCGLSPDCQPAKKQREVQTHKIRDFESYFFTIYCVCRCADIAPGKQYTGCEKKVGINTAGIC